MTDLLCLTGLAFLVAGCYFALGVVGALFAMGGALLAVGVGLERSR